VTRLRVMLGNWLGYIPQPLPSTGVSRLPRYYGPLHHPKPPGTSLTNFRLVIPDHAKGLPVLRALSLSTCCRHYPGTATGGLALLIHPDVSAFPGRVVGSACASSFSRLAQRSLALRPAHSRCHRFCGPLSQGFSHFLTSIAAPVASGWSISPGGIRTHCKAPPLHGAHAEEPFRFFGRRAATQRVEPFTAL
jgi:hypothetical protein